MRDRVRQQNIIMAVNQEPLQHETDTGTPFTPQNTSTQTSHFFNLSAELRNIIYAEVLEHDDALWFTANRRSTVDDGKPPLAEPPALLQVCRLMPSEALTMFYASNTFSITLMNEANVTRAKCRARVIGDSATKSTFRLRLHGHMHWPHGVLQREPLAPVTRVGILKKPDGSIHLDDAYADSAGARLRARFGPVSKVRTGIRKMATDHEPLSSVEDLVAVVEMFASRLSFREYEYDSDSFTGAEGWYPIKFRRDKSAKIGRSADKAREQASRGHHAPIEDGRRQHVGIREESTIMKSDGICLCHITIVLPFRKRRHV